MAGIFRIEAFVIGPSVIASVLGLVRGGGASPLASAPLFLRKGEFNAHDE